MKNKYCSGCGSKCESKFINEFDTETGEKIYEPDCFNSNCETGKTNIFWRRADNCDHNMKDLDLIPFFGTDGVRCTKCGMITNKY